MGKHTFTLELHLSRLCVKECPKGGVFAAFVDPMVIFCFYPSYTPLTGWETLTKAMEKLGNIWLPTGRWWLPSLCITPTGFQRAKWSLQERLSKPLP